MEPRLEVYQSLEKHVPANAVHYCFDIWAAHEFGLKVTRKRHTKLGDYRFNRQAGTHRISVNGNLNNFSFLITYLHEVAHLMVKLNHKARTQPHGTEWKSEFGEILAPMMNDLVFPESVLKPLKRHMRNPKASSGADPRLARALRAFDQDNGSYFLSELDLDQNFRFKKKTYLKKEDRRTRALCQEVKTGRNYLIPLVAEVEMIK